MEYDESLQRSRSEVEMLMAAYPDEITVVDNHTNIDGDTIPSNSSNTDTTVDPHTMTFPFRFRLTLSGGRASITMQLINGYPEDTSVEIVDFRSTNPIDKARLDTVVKSVKQTAHDCQVDGMEGAISCCSTAFEVWDDSSGDEVADGGYGTSSIPTNDNDDDGGVDCQDQSSTIPSTTSPLHKQQQGRQSSTTAKTKTYAWVSGEPLVDRKSVFQAHLLTHVESLDDIQMALPQLLQSSSKMQRATHHMYAWRIVKSSSSSTKNSTSETVQHDNDDDGEDGAGSKLGYLLDMRQDTNVLVVVSRWYGGIHLGPKRFAHIVNVARELLAEHTTSPTNKYDDNNGRRGGGGSSTNTSSGKGKKKK